MHYAPHSSQAPLGRRWALWWRRVWLCLCMAGALGAHAAHPASTAGLPPVLLDGRASAQALAGHSAYWIDPLGQLTVQDVERQQDRLPFEPREAGQRVRLDGGAALWVRFDLVTNDRSRNWELELARSGTDRVSLYHRQADGRWHEQHAGDRLPVSAWVYNDRYPVFDLDAQGDVPVRYWVRIEHARVPFSGELVIHSHGHLREARILQQFLLGGYFGMALLLMVVAAANAVVFRDSGFAGYALYISLLGLSLAASLGVGGQFLWPDSPWWNGQAEYVLLPLATVAGLLFVRHTVQPRRLPPWLNRLALPLAVTMPLIMLWDQWRPSVWSLQAMTVLGGLVALLIAAMLWAGWRTGERCLRWIALGMLPVLLAGAVPVLRNFDLLSSGFLSQYAMVLAAALEGPLLIYGLLQRSSIQHEAQTRAKALRLTEPLTGLTNRHNFMLRLHDSLVRAQRYKHQNAVLLIELDNHGWFVSEHGREVADRALVLTGSLLRSAARDVDTAARVDDNRFALLMEGPVRKGQAVAAATGILASGLRPSEQLPVGSVLRYKIVLALLPDDGHELQLEAQLHMDWLGDALSDLRQDKRKSIETLNF
jgi:diguanylate cyclase (GGDEF)-like protein